MEGRLSSAGGVRGSSEQSRVVVTTIVLGAVAFLVLGIAVSVVAFLVILIPAIAIVALLVSFLQPRRG